MDTLNMKRRIEDFDSIRRAAVLTGELQATTEFCARLGECGDWKIRGDGRGNFIIETDGREYRVVVEEIR